LCRCRFLHWNQEAARNERPETETAAGESLLRKTMTEQDQAKLEFIQQRILQIRTWLLQNPPGLTSVNREGFGAGYNYAELRKELEELEREEKKLDGRARPVVRPLDLSGSWE
jgi:hypothetical protein